MEEQAQGRAAPLSGLKAVRGGRLRWPPPEDPDDQPRKVQMSIARGVGEVLARREPALGIPGGDGIADQEPRQLGMQLCAVVVLEPPHFRPGHSHSRRAMGGEPGPDLGGDGCWCVARNLVRYVHST